MKLAYEFNASGEQRVVIKEGGHTYATTRYGVSKAEVRSALTCINLPYNEQDAISRRHGIIQDRLAACELR